MKTLLVSTRPANSSDRRFMWDLRLDPVLDDIRPRNQDIAYDQFCRRFDQTLENGQSLLVIGDIQSVRVGVTWFRESNPSQWEVLLYVKPAYTGRNVATAMLKSAMSYLLEHRQVNEIIRIVPRANPASGYAFGEAGFRLTSSDDVIHCSFKAEN